MIALKCPVCGNPVDEAIDGGCSKRCDDIFHGVEQMTTQKTEPMPDEIWIDSADGKDDCVYTSQWRKECVKYVRTDLYTAVCAERDSLKSKVNAAYTERMQVVLMLAKMSGCKYGVGKDDNESWEDEWRNVVYIDLPQGQVSWHIAPHDMHLFEGFPTYEGKWDGTFNGRSADFAKSVSNTERDALRAFIEQERNAIFYAMTRGQNYDIGLAKERMTAALTAYEKHKAGE